jgi:hypothetical protein
MPVIEPYGAAQVPGRPDSDGDQGFQSAHMNRDSNRIRILTVDDHPLLRAGIAGLIADEPDIGSRRRKRRMDATRSSSSADIIRT